MSYKLGNNIRQLRFGLRDATHVPFIVCHANIGLDPGDFVKLTSDFEVDEVVANSRYADGIVDPFSGYIPPGDKVVILVNPNHITEVTHLFAFKEGHDPASPDFEEDNDEEESDATDYCCPGESEEEDESDCGCG